MYTPKSRRVRLLALCFLFILFFQRHIQIGVKLSLMPLIFNRNTSLRLSSARDNFDVTFEQYSSSTSSPSSSSAATSSSNNAIAPENITYPVPAVIHNIFIGSKDNLRPSWALAAHACRTVHPDWNFEYWDNGRAERFVRRVYPGVWPTWKNYRYDIQRADSLRYMILHHYGGTYHSIFSSWYRDRRSKDCFVD